MRIALYFGSFNPVHNGHLIIANFIANYFPIDQVWFIVSPLNPLKRQGALLNEHHRKHLVDLSIDEERRMRTSNVEFHLPKPSFTIDTLTFLSEQYPDHEFSIVMGADSLSNISRWKNYEVLLKNYEIIVYRREGFEIIPFKNSKIIVAKAPLLNISSSMIREMIKEKKSIRFLVPDIVKEEIERNGYYSER